MIDTGDLLDWVASVGWQTPHSTVTKNQTMSEFILVSYFYANFCIKNEDQFPLSSYVILYTHTNVHARFNQILEEKECVMKKW